LREDLGSGDLTTDAIFSEEPATAVIYAKASGIVAGLFVVKRVFNTLDGDLSVELLCDDGDRIEHGTELVRLSGRAASILRGERTALNFLQRLSGIATLTAQYAQELAGYKADVLDTRKTTPGLRIFEKYAIRVGGGVNHRIGLYDGVLIKENHIRAAGGIAAAVERARAAVPHTIKIEVETTSLLEVEEALASGAEIIMLDNMPTELMSEAVGLIANRAIVEASGGITLENIREVAATGVDFISVGALTHSARALDMSLEVTL